MQLADTRLGFTWGVKQGNRARARVPLREDRIGTGPPRARTQVIYVDLGYLAISESILQEGDPASWGRNTSVSRPCVLPHRCAERHMAHTRQSRPDSGLGFQVKVDQTFQVVPSSRGSGLDTDVARTLLEAPHNLIP